MCHSSYILHNHDVILCICLLRVNVPVLKELHKIEIFATDSVGNCDYQFVLCYMILIFVYAFDIQY